MAAWFWLVLCVLLVAAEALSSLAFVALMFAFGALAAALTAALGGSIWVQLPVAVLVAGLLLVSLRPLATRRLRNPRVRFGTARLVGLPALALTDVDDASGRVKLDGQEWTARSLDREILPAGSRVQVVRIAGATAVVRREEPPL